MRCTFGIWHRARPDRACGRAVRPRQLMPVSAQAGCQSRLSPGTQGFGFSVGLYFAYFGGSKRKKAPPPPGVRARAAGGAHGKSGCCMFLLAFDFLGGARAGPWYSEARAAPGLFLPCSCAFLRLIFCSSDSILAGNQGLCGVVPQYGCLGALLARQNQNGRLDGLARDFCARPPTERRS